jgi:hypothetical protein
MMALISYLRYILHPFHHFRFFKNKGYLESTKKRDGIKAIKTLMFYTTVESISFQALCEFSETTALRHFAHRCASQDHRRLCTAPGALKFCWTIVITVRIDGNQRYSWIKNQRSWFVSRTRLCSLRLKTIN